MVALPERMPEEGFKVDILFAFMLSSPFRLIGETSHLLQ